MTQIMKKKIISVVLGFFVVASTLFTILALNITPVTLKRDIFEYEYKPGDSIIICSDGLSGMVEDATILKTVQDGKSSKEIADNLCELAKKNGGVDNITVIAIRIMEEESSI